MYECTDILACELPPLGIFHANLVTLYEGSTWYLLFIIFSQQLEIFFTLTFLFLSLNLGNF